MFENGEMAPMAYSYLMAATYFWIMSDDQSEKEKYHNLLEDFRKTGYTKTGIKFFDENIMKMPSLPTNSITEEEHFFRNCLNISFTWEQFQLLQSKLPSKYKWKELDSALENMFHQNSTPGLNNRKFVSHDGHFELVYKWDGQKGVLLTVNNSPENMGTYNYYGPNKAYEHFLYDVKPYFLYGNVKGSSENPIVQTIELVFKEIRAVIFNEEVCY